MANILVVDDEMGIRELLNEILSDEGHVVYSAENAQQARTIRDQLQPDLVLLDIWMPDTDGVTLLKEWSKDNKLTMPVTIVGSTGDKSATIDKVKILRDQFQNKKYIEIDVPKVSPTAFIMILGILVAKTSLK